MAEKVQGYNQSNVTDQGPELYLAFVLTCIYNNLSDVIETESAGRDTLVYNSGYPTSFMKILEKYCDNLHPIHVRHHKLANLYPGANQSASGYFTEFLRQANEADTSAISNDRLLLALMTTRFIGTDIYISP